MTHPVPGSEVDQMTVYISSPLSNTEAGVSMRKSSEFSGSESAELTTITIDSRIFRNRFHSYMANLLFTGKSINMM